MRARQDVEIVLAPYGNNCRVLVNGEPVPVYKVEIVAEVREPTRFVLHCLKNGGEPFVLRGRMVVEVEE